MVNSASGIRRKLAEAGLTASKLSLQMGKSRTYINSVLARLDRRLKAGEP